MIRFDFSAISLLPAGLRMFLTCLFFRNTFTSNLSWLDLVRLGSASVCAIGGGWLVTASTSPAPSAQTAAAVCMLGKRVAFTLKFNVSSRLEPVQTRGPPHTSWDLGQLMGEL